MIVKVFPSVIWCLFHLESEAHESAVLRGHSYETLGVRFRRVAVPTVGLAAVQAAQTTNRRDPGQAASQATR